MKLWFIAGFLLLDWICFSPCVLLKKNNIFLQTTAYYRGIQFREQSSKEYLRNVSDYKSQHKWYILKETFSILKESFC